MSPVRFGAGFRSLTDNHFPRQSRREQHQEHMKDKNNKGIVKGATVRIKIGSDIITGKVTGIYADMGRVEVADNHVGKGTRGVFSVEAYGVEVVTTKKAKR